MKRTGILFFVPLFMMFTVSADMDPADSEPSHDLETRTVAHVAIVVRDIEATTKAYAGLFGMEPPPIRLGKSPDYMGHPTEGKAKMAFIQTGKYFPGVFSACGRSHCLAGFFGKQGGRSSPFWILGGTPG